MGRAATFTSCMITLTERAARAVEALQKERGGPGKRLRIYIEAGGCSGLEYAMSFDEAHPGDLELEAFGVPYLVEPKSMERLSGSEVDFDDGLAGKGFEVRNPNAKSTCGCGRSFN